VSVCISEDEAGFSLAMWIRGNWLRTKNALWPDLPSAMAAAITLLSPPADEPADEPKQLPDRPPLLSGEWQSCEHGIDADDGEWIFVAWEHASGWRYHVAQVSGSRGDETNAHSCRLLDTYGNDIDWEPSDFYMRIQQ